MAFGNSTLDFAGGAVNDIFSSGQKAAGLRISASGTRIQGEAGRLRARGDEVEAGNYDLASKLASQNEEFTRQSTAVQQVMADRQIYQALGEERASVAGSGFQQSGSALDILRDSAQQGALQKQLLGQQGLITEAGYREQSESFNSMAGYARFAAGEETKMAGEMDEIASRTDKLAKTTETQGYISAGIKAASAVATLFI